MAQEEIYANISYEQNVYLFHRHQGQWQSFRFAVQRHIGEMPGKYPLYTIIV